MTAQNEIETIIKKAESKIKELTNTIVSLEERKDKLERAII